MVTSIRDFLKISRLRTMDKIVAVLMAALLGCSPVIGSTPRNPYSTAFLARLTYQCQGPLKGQGGSRDLIRSLRTAHEKWAKDSTDPHGRRADFCEAMLAGIVWPQADLRSALFQMAMLAGADLTGAILDDAQMQGVNLSQSKLSKASLRGVNLQDAMLHLANFREANLQGASLHQAMLFQVQLQGADLTDVTGLTQYQVDMACLDETTKLPQGLRRPEPC